MDTLKETLAARDFERLRSLIKTECGISLNPEKKTMLEIRLRRRLRTLEFSTAAEYCNYVFARESRGQELVHLIDAVTTNKTDFFREPDHFDYLAATALPTMEAKRGPYWKPFVWSAGCSTGEEPYTVAMVLSEYAERRPGFRFTLLATDICTEVLEKARAGIFRAEALKPVPLNIRKKYFMRSRDPGSGLYRAVPELRAKIEFRRLNFMDSDYGLPDAPDMIFCRNVIIYFDRPTQVRILEKLTRQLAPGGYFFAGHSESLQHMDLPLVSTAPAVYRKTT
jgi:chemotaxis protein methyltransferase CheR